MKRLLSMLLAIALVVGMIPAVFATEGEATQQDAGITITYDVTKNFGTWNNQTVQFADFTYEANNGLWEYVANSKNLLTADKSVTINWSGTDGMQMRDSGNWWAIKIIVPKSGVYTPKINYRAYDEAAMLNLYLIKKTGELKSADFTSDNSIGSINCYNSECTAVTTQEPYALEPLYIEAGEYYFVYSTGEKTSPGGTGWVFFGNFTLDGNGTDTVLASIITNKTAVVPMGESCKLASKLYLSDGSCVSDGYVLTYESSDNDIATVDADGNITSVATGNATVTVSITNEAGYTVKAETNVVVSDGASLVYDFPSGMRSLGMKYQADTTAYPLTLLVRPATKGYSFHSSSNVYNDSSIRYYDFGMQLRRNVWVALEIDVPVAGAYVIKINSRSGTNSRMNINMNVYISKDAASTSNADLIGYYNAYDTSLANSTDITPVVGTVNIEEPGKYIITIKNSSYYYDAANVLTYNSSDVYSTFGIIELCAGNKTAVYDAEITSTASSINVDKNENAMVGIFGNFYAFMKHAAELLVIADEIILI